MAKEALFLILNLLQIPQDASPAFGNAGHTQTKKADVAEHPEVFNHVGLLVNEPSSYAGMLFV